MRRLTMMAGSVLLAGALALTAGMLPTAAIAAETTATAQAPTVSNDSEWPDKGDLRGTISTKFNLLRLSLTDGALMSTAWRTSDVPATLAETTPNFVHTPYKTWGTFGGSADNSNTGIEAKVVYRVSMLGQATPYWIKASVWEENGKAWGACEFFTQDPRSPGAQPETAGPFNCIPNTTNGLSDGQAVVQFDLSLNRSVEASGTLSTKGPISLADGYFEHDSIPYHIDGSTDLGTDASTTFGSVLRETDFAPKVHNLSRTRFYYQIVDAGVPSNFWVGGWVQNERDRKYNGLQRCNIYDRSPGKGSDLPLDQQPTVKVSPYDCENAQTATGDNGHYDAAFTVVRRAMVESDATGHTFEARDRINRVCAVHPEDCGVTIAKVTDFVGPGKVISDLFENNSKTKIWVPHLIMSSTTSYTNSGGFEIDILTGSPSLFGVGPKFEVTLKVHYDRSVTTSETKVFDLPIPVPPLSRGWIESAPQMVRTQGTVIVLEDGVYYEMTNVDATFPRTDTTWVTGGHSEPLTKGGLGGQDPEPSGGTPAVLLPGASGTPPHANSANPAASANSPAVLARTGATSNEAGVLGGLAALSIGGLIFVIARRRRRTS